MIAALSTLAALLIASLMLNWTLFRQGHTYRDSNPPTSDFVPGKCREAGLVGHWRFDELSRTDARVTPDAGAYANHARLHVIERPFSALRYGLPKPVAGIDGTAMELRGRQWLAAGNNDCFAVERFTFAAWIRLEQTGNVPTIAGKASWPHNGWWLLTTTRGPQPEDRYLDLGIAWPGGRAHVQSGYQLPLHEWHHIVVTADNERREVAFFIDGKPVSRHRDVPRWQVNWDHDFVIGDFDGSTRWPWIGGLDDVRFYNRVLTEAESIALYSAPTMR